MFKTNAIKSTCVKKDNRKPVNSMARSYLKPEYDSRASFYNKAETDDDKLYSYGTLVAEIINGKPVLYDDWDYSQTTIRHVREFLRQHGFNAESKSQIARDYLTNSRKAIKSDNSRRLVKSSITDNDECTPEEIQLLCTYADMAFEDIDWLYDSDANTLAEHDYDQQKLYEAQKIARRLAHSVSKNIQSSKKIVKSGLLDETKGQQVEQFREEIRRDVDTALNEICYNYQEKLGITTGDSWEELDIDYVTENIIKVLKDQLINFM